MLEKRTHKFKILNDPIYGFITIPNVLLKDGSVKEWLSVANTFNTEAITQPVTKYFLTYPKEVMI